PRRPARPPACSTPPPARSGSGSTGGRVGCGSRRTGRPSSGRAPGGSTGGARARAGRSSPGTGTARAGRPPAPPAADGAGARGQGGDAHVWDTQAGEHLRRVSVRFQHQFALSPDGRLLVWPEMDPAIAFPSPNLDGTTRIGSRLRLMDVTTGKIDERFGGFEGN